MLWNAFCTTAPLWEYSWGESVVFPHKRTVMRGFDVFFAVNQNKLLNEHVRYWLLETAWRSCDVAVNNTYGTCAGAWHFGHPRFDEGVSALLQASGRALAEVESTAVTHVFFWFLYIVVRRVAILGVVICHVIILTRTGPHDWKEKNNSIRNIGSDSTYRRPFWMTSSCHKGESKSQKFHNIAVPTEGMTYIGATIAKYRCLLQWRHNGPGCVSNHRRLGCLLKRLFRRR